MAEEEERPSCWEDEDWRGELPPGFRFKPGPEEFVEFYLLPKLEGNAESGYHVRELIEANVYECEPDVLIERYKDRGENAWYFLSPRKRKYPGGCRPSRRTEDNRGRWKPSTGKSKAAAAAAAPEEEEPVPAMKSLRNGKAVFCESILAFHEGPPKNEKKTKWLMLELTVPSHEIKTGELLDRYVACKIYLSPLKKWNTSNEEEKGSTSSARVASSPPPPASPASQFMPAPPAPTERQAGKRIAEEQSHGRTPAPKRAARPALAHRPAAPVHGGGGVGVQAPLGAGAGVYYGVPGQGAPPPRPPPWVYNQLQGPVQRLPLMYNYNGRMPPMPYGGQSAAQAPPPHAAAIAPSYLGRAMATTPTNLAGAQPFRAAPSAPSAHCGVMVMRAPGIYGGRAMPPPCAAQPPPPRQQKQETMDEENKHRVYAQMIAEYRRNFGGAAGAHEARLAVGASRAAPAGSTPPRQPLFDGGANNNPARAVLPRTQFLAPRNRHPCNGGQQQQQRVCSLATPTASAPCGGAAAAEATAAAGDASGKLPLAMAGDRKEGSVKAEVKGDDNGEQLFADLAAMKTG
ncbi:hypothetical protein ACP4OV_004168 [Aristida adscensionis]